MAASGASPAAAGGPPVFSQAYFNAAAAARASGTPTASGQASAPLAGPANTLSVQRSIQNFTAAARALANAQASQAAAAAAAAATSAVPNGLTSGGLVPNPSIWQGAALPTQSTAPVRTTVTVKQTQPTALLNWQSFNIGSSTTLTFDQSAGGSSANTWIALNRVNDPTAKPSQILGSITAPGQVLVLNRNGVLFGAGAQVNVHSLIVAATGAAVGMAADAATQAAADQMLLSYGIYPTANNNQMTPFANTAGDIIVQAGASITTAPPASATERGGSVILIGHAVQNNGAIATPAGQALLAAGGAVTLAQGYNGTGATASLTSAISTTLGSDVASIVPGTDAASGVVGNTGVIQATTGDITLAGHAVTQGGVLNATTSVNQRGSIHLLTDTNATDPTATVALAPGSTAFISPDQSGATALNSQRAGEIPGSAGYATHNTPVTNNPLLTFAGLPDRLDQSRLEITSGSTVSLGAGSLAEVTGGQIAISAGTRTHIATGAILDVSGYSAAMLPASANTLAVNLQSYELRDAVANRLTGNLKSQNVTVDIRQLVSVGTSASNPGDPRLGNLYTPGGLVEVSGEVSNVPHTINEWLSPGGAVTVSSPQLVAQPGALVNLAGGTINYAGGLVPTSWLIGTDGRLYNVNTAPANVIYTGVYNGFVVQHPRWGVTQTFRDPLIAPAELYDPAYSVGKDGGALTIASSSVLFEAGIDAGVQVGTTQIAARPAGVTDSYQLAANVVPLPGTLTIGPIQTPGLSGANPIGVYPVSALITDAAPAVAASVDVGTPIPGNLTGTAILSASQLTADQLGGLSITASLPNAALSPVASAGPASSAKASSAALLPGIVVDAPLTLAYGAAVSFTAPSTAISGTISARGGSVNITDVVAANGSSVGLATVGTSAVTLATGGTIDTRGVFTNLLLGSAKADGQAWLGGGAVKIDSSQGVMLAAGSLIDASAGGVINADTSQKGGTGGNITITGNDSQVYPTQTTAPPFALAGTLRSLGSTAACAVGATCKAGGSLTIQAPAILISDAPAPATGPLLTLPSSFFSSGFSSYTLNGLLGVTVDSGTRIAVTEPTLQATPATLTTVTGTDPAAAYSTGLLPVVAANASAATIVRRPGASLTLQSVFLKGLPIQNGGPISLGENSSISVDPGQSVVIEAASVFGQPGPVRPSGQITVAGMISAPGGVISIQNDGALVPQNAAIPAVAIPLNANLYPYLSVWIDRQAAFDVSGVALTGTDRYGRSFGSVLPGGSIIVGSSASDAFTVISAGATLTAKGASAAIDTNAGLNPILASRTGPTPSSQVLIASNGGSISLASQTGIVIDGTLSAAAGGPGALGGSLSLTLTSPVGGYNVVGTPPQLQVPDFLAVPRVLTVSPYMPTALDPGVQPGVASLVLQTAVGNAQISTGAIALGGFDKVSLRADDAIQFAPGTVLTTGGSIVLTTPVLATSPVAPGAPPVVAAVNAPYVELIGSGSNGTSLPGGQLAQRVTGAGITGGSTETDPSSLLTVTAGVLDIRDLILIGQSYVVTTNFNNQITTKPAIDNPGFGTVDLRSSGDIRFLTGVDSGGTTKLLDPGTATLPGSLTLAAAQIYPASGANVTVLAGLLNLERTTADVPAVPLTLGGILTLQASTINQGAVLRAPLGTLTLGSPPPDSKTPGTQTVNLEAGSVTSLSLSGATVLDGGTTDGLTYATASNANYTLGASVLTVNAQSLNILPGATVDLSGGGTLAGAGFIAGRGGSANVLTTPLLALSSSDTVTLPSSAAGQVYAILPGSQAGPAQPVSVAANWSNTGTPAEPMPIPGQQITVGSGVPGLPAGTYRLLPAADALLPGAFRVELSSTPAQLGGVTTLLPSSYRVPVQQSIGGTPFAAALPVNAVITPGAAIRTYSQYDEETYSAFAIAQFAQTGANRAPIPEDAKSLLLNFSLPTGQVTALSQQGTTNFAAAPNGYGSTVIVNPVLGGSGSGGPQSPQLEITADYAIPTPGFVSVRASDLNALGATTLAVGAMGNPTSLSLFATSSAQTIVRYGATLSAPLVLVEGNAVTLEPGASINTIGRPDAVTPLLSTTIYQLGGYTDSLVLVGNAQLQVQAAPQPVGGGTKGSICIGGVATGGCAAGTAPTDLYTSGTVTFATNGGLTLGQNVLFGASNIAFSLPAVNIGSSSALTAAAADNTLPTGFNLTQDVLSALLHGNPAVGTPALRSFTLTANQSVNIFGTTSLSTLDPTTNTSTLNSFVINTPAIYGAGGNGDIVTITTGTLALNGAIGNQTPGTALQPGTAMSAVAPAPIANGPGSGLGILRIVADQIVLGYPDTMTPPTGITPFALGRTLLGFSEVDLTANTQIVANNAGSLTVYQSRLPFDATTQSFAYQNGNLVLTTPLLTGAGGAVLSVTAGGSLTIAPPPGILPTAAAGGTGAEIDLSAASFSNATSIVLQGGKLTATATAGDIALLSGSRIDLSGPVATIGDQTRIGSGGTLSLQSTTGNIVQLAGARIDVSSSGANAGSVALTATQGQVSAAGSLAGGATAQFTSGSFSANAATFDFDALNASLAAGGFFGSRSFDLHNGDLAINGVVKASTVTVSVDTGGLTVNGTIDASGPTPGTIRLSGQTALTIASSAVLDAHASVLQTDSRGVPIDSENAPTIELTAHQPGSMLTLGSGAAVNLSSADGVARGTLTLNAPRSGASDVGLAVAGPVNIAGAQTVAVNAFRIYTAADSTGAIAQPGNTQPGSAALPLNFTTAAGTSDINQDNVAFINAALGNPALLARLTNLGAYHLRPGVEIDSAAGGNLTVQGDLDFSGYRYGPNAKGNGSGEPGDFVLRAAGNLYVFGSITDGFGTVPVPAAGNPDSKGWYLYPTIVATTGASIIEPNGADVTLPAAVTLPVGTQFSPGSPTILTQPVMIGTGTSNVNFNTQLQSALNGLTSIQSTNAVAIRRPITVKTGSVTLPNGGRTYAAGQQIPGSSTFKLPQGTIYSGNLTFTSCPSGSCPQNVTYFNPTATLTAGTTIPFAVTLSRDLTSALAAEPNVVLAAAITRPNLPTLPVGTLLTPGTSIPVGSVLAAGTNLPVNVTFNVGSGNTIGQILVPAGVDLAKLQFVGGTGTNGPYITQQITLAAGTVLPNGTAFPNQTPIQLRPATSGAQGQIWAIAPLLPAGSQSWSFRLVGGADLGAADTRAVTQPSRLAAGASSGGTPNGSVVFSDLHYQEADATGSPAIPTDFFQGLSVVRTGTGSLDILAGGDVNVTSLYGIYTAGASAGNVAAAYNLPRGSSNVISGLANVLDMQPSQTSASPYEQLVRNANYTANYPTGGGNLFVSAQQDILQYNHAFPTDLFGDGLSTYSYGDVGTWLWRQGDAALSQPAAWWINFGTYTLPLDSTGQYRPGPNFVPQLGVNFSTSVGPLLTGFTGFGTLGGGNVTISAGGGAGGSQPASSPITVAVGSTGRVPANAINSSGITETGGGFLSINIGTSLNGGVITDTRGSVTVQAGSIGQVAVSYNAAAVDPLLPTEGTGIGGATLILGDASAAISTRGDLVISSVGDATRQTQQNLTPVNGAASGDTWFSLWQATTSVSLFSAGGNVVPATPVMTQPNEIYPPTLKVVAAAGSIYAQPGTQELAPAPAGQLEWLAAGSIISGQPATAANTAFASYVLVSGADPTQLPTPLDPAYADIPALNGTNQAAGPSHVLPTAVPNALFALAADVPTGTLHAGDPIPALIEANLDIVDLKYGKLTVNIDKSVTPQIAAKATRIIAGRDIVDPGMGGTDLILNNSPTDISVLEAGRDILGASLDVSGPGLLYIQAGRNIQQNDPITNTTGSFESLGLINPTPGTRSGGAGLTLVSGVGASTPAWTDFAALYLNPNNVAPPGVPISATAANGLVFQSYADTLLPYLQSTYDYTGDAAGALTYFDALSPEARSEFLLPIFYNELRQSGREYNDATSPLYQSYTRGREAIATLFPPTTTYGGSLTEQNQSGIQTDQGGAIDILTPGGQTILGVTSNTAAKGVLTQGQGDIGIYSLGSVLLGQSRVFTTFGGGITIWSATGDVNAGAGAKTSQVTPAVDIVYDQFGNIVLSPGAPTTGAGIATLAPLAGVTPGDVDLIAPLGTIDAGEAGIRASGNANLAALTLANAANVVSVGKTTGTPAIVAPNVGAALAASTAASAAAQAAQSPVNQASAAAQQNRPSNITVEVIGFGE